VARGRSVRSLAAQSWERYLAPWLLRNGLTGEGHLRYVTRMTLTNAERQARYRERLRRLASRVATLNPILADLLIRTRLNIREWKRSLALFEAGLMHIYAGQEDRTAEQVTNLRRMIAENGALLAQYDTEGLTIDGDIELGNIGADIVAQLWAGRPVSYMLDMSESAIDLRLFETDAAAQIDAASPGRRAGRIGEQGWSIAAALADGAGPPGGRCAVDHT